LAGHPAREELSRELTLGEAQAYCMQSWADIGVAGPEAWRRQRAVGVQSCDEASAEKILHSFNTWTFKRDGPVRPGPFGNGEFARVLGNVLRGRCIRWFAVARRPVPCLKLDQLVETRRVRDEFRRKTEELASSAVDDGNWQVLGYQHDSLAHVFEC